MSRLEVEDDEVGQVGTMLILAAKDEELVTLIQSSSVSHPDTGDVSIIVYQAPLMTGKIQAQNMIVNFVRVLVEASESVNGVVAAVGNRGIHQASRSLAQGPDHLGAVVSIDDRPVL